MRFTRVTLVPLLLALGAFTLSGCFSPGDILEGVIEDVAQAEGENVDVEFGEDGVTIEGDGFGVELGGGESCLPGWVNAPEGETMFRQGIRATEGGTDIQVCVVGWEDNSGTDLSQSLPQLDIDATGEQVREMLLLVATQLAVQTGRSDIANLATQNIDDVIDKLAQEGVDLRVYGDDSRVLLVLAAEGEDGSDPIIAIGLACGNGC